MLLIWILRLTNSRLKETLWEAYSRLADDKLSSFHGARRFTTVFQNSPPLVSAEPVEVNIFTPYVFKIHFNII
jgi:hypothetical protein